jgi:hypothetical protein
MVRIGNVELGKQESPYSVLKIEEFLFIRGPEGNEKRVISSRKAKHT